MNEMKRTLQTGTAKVSTVRTQFPEKTSGWRVGFWRPLDAALHLGTPPQSQGTVKSAPFGDGPMFID